MNLSLRESTVVSTDLAIPTVTVAAVFHGVRKRVLMYKQPLLLAE